MKCNSTSKQIAKSAVHGPYKRNERASDDEKLREHLQKSHQSQTSLESGGPQSRSFQRSEEIVKLLQKLKEGMVHF